MRVQDEQQQTNRKSVMTPGFSIPLSCSIHWRVFTLHASGKQHVNKPMATEECIAEKATPSGYRLCQFAGDLTYLRAVKTAQQAVLPLTHGVEQAFREDNHVTTAPNTI
jgi:hypothetical protein